MKRVIALYLVFMGITGNSVLASIHSFDDFSTISTDPVVSGTLSDNTFTITFSGDDGDVETNLNNGSWNGLVLGDNTPSTRTANLAMAFNIPIVRIEIEFDAMHRIQNDQVTASDGTWTVFPASLSLAGRTLTSTAPVINPGGSNIDDDLLTLLLFDEPVSSLTLSSRGAFILDSLTVTTVPEPATLALLALGGLALRKRK